MEQDSPPSVPDTHSSEKRMIPPSKGELITSLATNNTYTMGDFIGEGNFGEVYSCTDVWNNDLAAKVLKPISSYERVRASAENEFAKLMTLRNPYITFVYDAFEFRDTFYIITEYCHGPIKNLFQLEDLHGQPWLMPIARCLLQAVHYLHINHYAHQDIHNGNVFMAIVKDEMTPKDRDAMVFKLGDLGVSKLFDEIDAMNTRAKWLQPPEVLDPSEFGPIDHRIDIYHSGLLLLELAYSKELRFSQEDIVEGKPRSMALELPTPFNFALEKALRRHVQYRTASAMELWRDLHSTHVEM